jgi:hypothetical protein
LFWPFKEIILWTNKICLSVIILGIKHLHLAKIKHPKPLVIWLKGGSSRRKKEGNEGTKERRKNDRRNDGNEKRTKEGTKERTFTATEIFNFIWAMVRTTCGTSKIYLRISLGALLVVWDEGVDSIIQPRCFYTRY